MSLGELGLTLPDLYQRAGLQRLDAAFLEWLRGRAPEPHARLLTARDTRAALSPKDASALLLELAPHLDAFIGGLFGIEDELAALIAHHRAFDPLHAVKRQFVQRRALHRITPAEAAEIDGPELEAELERLLGSAFSEIAFARAVQVWLGDEANHADALDVATRYAAWSATTDAGRRRHRDGTLFRVPRKLDPAHLVHARTDTVDGCARYHFEAERLRERHGFALTDPGTALAGALDETHYCIWCHEQGKDSCSRGLRDKAPQAGYRKSAFGVTLAGCPLEERISEFQMAKSRGQPIAALALICIDNPMAACTGHRICNDCMKSCIYQKQDPVNIPQAETRSLKDVLELPWGFEIYSLLTRWNPLNLARPLPAAATGKRVLVVGLGPAGFTLAHHLMNDGHTVVAVDGLKIEPLPAQVSGVLPDGTRNTFAPVREVRELFEPLDARVMAGFGGVAEYGITVRWDKNFLKLVRLLLERRDAFSMFGGVRFGGTLTLDDAWTLGFDHVALCVGAGKPTMLDIPNGLARGVRAASDFLMALQLSGAAKADSIANMQLRLPVVVIGGGLTAVDTATESLAYYVVQVEKFLSRYEVLAAAIGEDAIRDKWDDQEREIAEEFLAHGRAIRAERDTAAREGRVAQVIALLQGWGGVTIAYRRRLIDSPAYTLNHEEVEKALEEGIVFAEGLTPTAVDTDNYGACRGVRFAVAPHASGAPGELFLPAHTVFVAAGTQPNTVLAREQVGALALDGRYFRACDEEGRPVVPIHAASKPGAVQVLLHRHNDGRFVSFFGDVHPSFFGNVVKAMGSAKQGYPVISRVLGRHTPASPLDDDAFVAALNASLRPVVERVVRLTPTIVEVVIRAPMAARRFRPGQFYRLQNYECLAPVAHGTRMQMEGIAVTGAWVDPGQGLVSTIVLEMGGSSDLCAMLRPGEPVVLMGPTGTPTDIVAGETVVLCGGGLGNAVLFSIGQALRAAGSRVLYFAGYKKTIDRYKVDDIESAADAIVWCCDELPGFAARRPQDRSFVGNIVQAMEAYASGRLGAVDIPLEAADRIVAIGSDRMMAAVARARHDLLKPHLKPGHAAIGSINSPMQCMMKEICAQCLQPHHDPEGGKTRYVFSCFNQDQHLDHVDFAALNERLKQNSLAEKLTACWIRHCMPALKAQRRLV